MGPRHLSRGIGEAPDRPRAVSLASMGPRHLSRGIHFISGETCKGRVQLQWGHGI